MLPAGLYQAGLTEWLFGSGITLCLPCQYCVNIVENFGQIITS